MIFLFCAELSALTFLAKTQNDDGSWGCHEKLRPARPDRVDAEAKKKADALIEKFQSDDIDVREAAQIELEKMGIDAIASLLDAADGAADEETRERCETALRRIAEPGRPSVETTALALLAFLGAGYSHLSRDTHSGFCYGTTVKKGFIHILSLQGPDGSFSLIPSAHAIATLAVAEAFKLSGSMLFKDGLENARKRLEEHLSDDPRVRFWQALALGRPLRFDGDDPWSLAGAAAIGRDEAKVRMLTALDLSVLDPELLFATTLAAFRLGGHATPLWKRWSPSVKAHLVLAQVQGSWEGEPRTTALNTMTLEIYYRYANALGGK